MKTTASHTTKKPANDTSSASDSTLSDMTAFSSMTIAPPTPAAATPAPTVTRVGNESSVNGITAGGEFFSSVASFADGSYVVAYTDTSYSDGEENAGIRMRLFNKDGTPAGNDIHVNTTVAGGQYLPQIAILASGDFVI